MRYIEVDKKTNKIVSGPFFSPGTLPDFGERSALKAVECHALDKPIRGDLYSEVTGRCHKPRVNHAKVKTVKIKKIKADKNFKLGILLSEIVRTTGVFPRISKEAQDILKDIRSLIKETTD